MASGRVVRPADLRADERSDEYMSFRTKRQSRYGRQFLE
jgi:hypothetical protein